MKIVKLENAETGQNSDVCKTIEYSFQDKDIDLGIATITGRFPNSGYALNLVSKELVYVLEGSGTIHFENKEINYSKGDAILILPNEKYYYETEHSVLTLSCTPAWSKEQHKIIS